MVTKSAHALNNTLHRWMVNCTIILNSPDEEYKYMQDIKSKFEYIRFDKLYEDFMAELKDNIREYRNIEYIDKYLEGAFTIVDDHEDYDAYDESIKGEIIKKGYEVKFLLRVVNAIDEYRKLLIELYYSNNSTSYSDKLRKIFAEVMQETEPEFNISSIDDEEDPKEKDEDIGKFSFDFLKAEIDCAKSYKDKVYLIKNRMIDIEQWYIRKGSDLGDYIFDSPTYAGSEFFRLCESELKRIRLLRETDETAVAHTALSEQQHPFQWSGSDTEFLELFTALYHSGKIQKANGEECSRKEFLEYLQKLLGLMVKDPEGKLRRAGERDKNTPFIDELGQRFRNYVAGKEEKKERRR